MARDEQLMDAVCDVAVQHGVRSTGWPGTAHEQVAKRRGVGFVSEFYVDLGTALMAEHTVPSPLPGVSCGSPSPTAPPFVEAGSSVTADETMGLIEIMKQFAEANAGADGSLTAFAVENESTVGPGRSDRHHRRGLTGAQAPGRQPG